MATNLSQDTSIDSIIKQIYTSCDSENTNQVPVSQLIEFVKPFVIGNELAFESLKIDLDPKDENGCISSETFHEVMTEWIKKLEAADDANNGDEFNRQLDITEEKNLPFTQSTPRASFGQRFLSCESLLHLSNVTGQDLSIIASVHDDSIVRSENKALQEEVKRLERQYNKVVGDIAVLKSQLGFMEEQNETLLADLNMCKTRLSNEQQTNEQLQKDKQQNEELREEISSLKSEMKELSIKLHQCEKENSYMSSHIHNLEQKNTSLLETCEKLKNEKKTLQADLLNLKADLDIKDHEFQILTTLNDELKHSLNHEREIIQELTNENNLLDYKKNTLEKRLHYRRYSAPSNFSKNDSQGTTCLIPIYSPSPVRDTSNLSFSYNSPSFLNKLQTPLTPILDTPVKRSKSNLLRSVMNCNSPLSLNKSPEATNCFSDVQDYSYDEFLFEQQLEQLKRSPQVSLQAELIQSQQLETNQSNIYQNGQMEEVINALQHEKDLLESKLKNLEEENSNISLNLFESHKINESLSQQLEASRKRKETDQVTANLNNVCNHVDLIKAYEDLKIEIESKEKELLEYKNKFNFEFAYKNTQTELGHKIKEVEEMKQLHNEFKDTIRKLSSKNQELEQQLAKAKFELHDIKYAVKSSIVNGDPSGDAKPENTLRKFIEKLEKDIESKNKDIIEMNENLKNEIEIKNSMWKINKDLKTENDKLNKKLSDFVSIADEINDLRINNKELMENMKECDMLIKEMEDLKMKCEELNVKLTESENINKKMKEEHNIIISKYNNELSKNSDLNKQVLEMPGFISKYHEESNKNLKLLKQIEELNIELQLLRGKQINLEKTISEYKNIIDKYTLRICELEKVNENVKSDLENKKTMQRECNKKILEYQEKLNNHYKTIEELKTEINERKNSSENHPSSWTFEKSGIETKNLSFEKQKLTIEKLKEKIENLEARLQNLQSQNYSLKGELKKKGVIEEKLMKLQEEYRDAQHKFICERQSLQTDIAELSSKLKEQADYYEKMSNASRGKITELSIKVAHLEEQNKNLQSDLSEKTSLLKRQYEAKELSNTFIKNINENLCKEHIKNHSLLNELKNKEDALSSISMDNENMKITRENLERQVKELSLTVLQHERELNLNKEEIRTLSNNLQEKDDTIEVLRNSLGDLTIKTLENNDAYETLLQTNKHLQERLSKTDDRKEEEIKEFENFKTKISLQTNILLHCCSELYRVIGLIKEKWHEELKNDARFIEMIPLEQELPVDLEDQIFCLAERVSAIVTLLEILDTPTPAPMDEFDLLEPHIPLQEIKPLKKFTLRPSRFIIGRPVSPDSPSLDISAQKEKSCGDHLLFKKASVSDSPDSQFGGNDTKSEFPVNLQLENRSSSHLYLPVQLPFDDAFPHLTDSFLEKLGLHEDSVKQILTKEETENTFTAFAIQIALDMKDVKERLENQRAQCQNNQKKCLYLLKDISMRLREHKCIGAVDSINPVFILLEDVRFMLQDIMQSAGQLGILSCENRMMRCWNLVTNYMAILKQETVAGSPKRITSLVDKGISATIYQENLSVQDVGNEIQDKSNDSFEENRNKAGYSFRDCFQYTKKICAWFFIIMVLLFIIVISLHWQCQMVPEHVICPLDEFIKKVNIGTPPY